MVQLGAPERSAGAQAAMLPLVVATLYAELLDLTVDDRALGYAEGGFARKTKPGGAAHWYRQRWVGARRVQEYVGPETPALLERIRRQRLLDGSRRLELSRRRTICRALRAALRTNMNHITGRILRALAQADAFQSGAVLIGTHAYAIYGAMLGRKLVAANVRTEDVDFAAVAVAIESPVSFADIIKSVDAKFFVVPPAPGSRITTKLKLQGSGYRVELLTPGPPGATRPVVIPNLKFGAAPVPYLGYLIRDTVDAAAPVDAGVRVKVPSPARFALHKLIVAQERGSAAAVKRAKDLAQSRELMTILHEMDRAALSAAWRDLERSGRAYTRRAVRSLTALGLEVADIA
jgi:hypothetical protein